MLYPGDTLYQDEEIASRVRFDLKNPRTGQLQTYYEYGNRPEEVLTPVFLKYEYVRYKNQWYEKEFQSFLDDYQKDGHQYWERKMDFPRKELTHKSPYYFYRWFYSDAIINLPVMAKPTGKTFGITVTETYLLEQENEDQVKVASRSKYYSDENKADYITNVLNKEKPSR